MNDGHNKVYVLRILPRVSENVSNTVIAGGKSGGKVGKTLSKSLVSSIIHARAQLLYIGVNFPVTLASLMPSPCIMYM